MSIQSYAELLSGVSDWLHRDGLTTRAPDFVLGGEDRINREVRCFEMETALAVTISGTGTAALPSDYGALKHAYLATASVQWLDRKNPETIYRKFPMRASGGLPIMIAREGSVFIFGPYPDSAYVVQGIYYKKFPALSGATNALFLESPLLYLYAALAEAEPFLKNDKRIALWEGKYAAIKKRVEQDTDSENWSGSNLRMTPA